MLSTLYNCFRDEMKGCGGTNKRSVIGNGCGRGNGQVRTAAIAVRTCPFTGNHWYDAVHQLLRSVPELRASGSKVTLRYTAPSTLVDARMGWASALPHTTR